MPDRPGLAPSGAGTIGHVVREYLPRSETFIYTVLRFQRTFTPAVYASRTENLSEFPFDNLTELAGPAPVLRRAVRRSRAHVAGFPGTYASRIARCARRDSCLALHAHFGWSGIAAVPAATRTGVPLITTFYGVDVSDAEPGRPRSRRYQRLFREGTRFICEGTAMATHLAANGCPQARIRVVRIGLDLALWPFRPAQRARPLIVAQASRFIEKKGIDLSLRAFAAARDRLGPSELWLIGDGRLRDDLELLAERLGITSSVRFLGMVSYAEYREILRRVHICVQPSRVASNGDTEGGAPTVLLEMQASGIPVVTTRHADIPAVVPDPDRLSAEDDVDAIANQLVAVSDLADGDWQAHTHRAREFVERHHDAAKVAGDIEAVYREVID